MGVTSWGGRKLLYRQRAETMMVGATGNNKAEMTTAPAAPMAPRSDRGCGIIASSLRFRNNEDRTGGRVTCSRGNKSSPRLTMLSGLLGLMALGRRRKATAARLAM
jgi:hypothetical protein